MSKFKVGDKVVRIQAAFNSTVPNGTLGTVKHIGAHSCSLVMEEYTGSFNPKNWVLQQPRKTTTPHKHAALIHAWADDPSLVIEHRANNGKWYESYDHSMWSVTSEYRIKPEKSEAELEMDAILEQIEDLKKKVAALKAWNK